MAVIGSLILVFVRTVRSKDDGPAGRERSVSPQSVSEDQLGGGNRESREHSQQVTRASSCSLCFSQRFCSETQNRGSRNGLKKPGCHFFLLGSHRSVMTHPRSCKESLLSTLMEAEILFKGPEPSQGKPVMTQLWHVSMVWQFQMDWFKKLKDYCVALITY